MSTQLFKCKKCKLTFERILSKKEKNKRTTICRICKGVASTIRENQEMSTRTKCGRCTQNETGVCKIKKEFKEYYENQGKVYTYRVHIVPFVNHDCEYFVDKRSKVI